MDFKLFIDALLSGAPTAILVALVGLVWQAFYTWRRDKAHDEQIKHELDLETQKFTHQKEIENIRFEYEIRSWREDLARDITLKLVEIRLEEYSRVWTYVEGVARNQLEDNSISPESTKAIAQKIKSWRYSKGGLIAEEITRDAAFTLQTALWDYDGTKQAYSRIRSARSLFRDALRADTGIGEVGGQTIYLVAEKQQKIRKELDKLSEELGIKSSSL